MANRYVCAEIDGQAYSCAELIHELRQKHQELLIDQEGFLLIPKAQWNKVQKLAAKHQCELRSLESSREAA